jgi:alpha-tubulin suppressor-like RCC1 family protein
MENGALVSSSYFHSIILDNNGIIWKSGDNQYQQLGDNLYREVFCWTPDECFGVQVENGAGSCDLR